MSGSHSASCILHIKKSASCIPDKQQKMMMGWVPKMIIISLLHFFHLCLESVGGLKGGLTDDDLQGLFGYEMRWVYRLLLLFSATLYDDVMLLLFFREEEEMERRGNDSLFYIHRSFYDYFQISESQGRRVNRKLRSEEKEQQNNNRRKRHHDSLYVRPDDPILLPSPLLF